MKNKLATFSSHKKNSRATMPMTSRFFVYLCLPFLLLSLAVGALAKDGRDFAGYYAISNIHDLGDAQDTSAAADRTAAVELTLTVQVFNYSDLGDIKEPVLELLGSELSPAGAGQFKAVKLLPSKRDEIVSGQFTISREEYKSWGHHGRGPNVVVVYKDESGRTLTQKVQLSRRPALPPPTAN
jgi:hypothetical protein